MKDLVFWYAIINFIVYIVVSTVLYFKKEGRLPPSISMTVYAVPRWYFVYFLMSSMGAVMLMNYQLDPDGFYWTNIGAVILCGVPAMAPIKNKKVLKAHMLFAIGGFSGIFLGLMLDFGAWWPVAVGLVTAVGTFAAFHKYGWVTTLIEIELIIIMLLFYK